MQLTSPSGAASTDLDHRILAAAQRLFARHGFEKTTTRQLAETAGIAEGTLFRHFENKKAILVAVVTQGWSELLTDLLTDLSEMDGYRSVAQLMRGRMLSLHKQADLMRVCFMEAQFHPELRDRIQSDIIAKMTSVVEAFIQTGIERGTYRALNPQVVAQVFLGMFMIAGFSQNTFGEGPPTAKAQLEMAETLAELFLNGILTRSE
ncbi:MAG: TetR/AcrR family transcriptional regulator [Acaryochloridaceae cyanobacterium SU_2_1]|nr:TetR/AcrR family transcriptional regulator [Acaryochloridaceae cyanobacterium SU_2_1]